MNKYFLEIPDQGMVFTVKARMRQTGDKIRNANRRRREQLIKSHHLSSFGILNRNGLEIPSGIEMPLIEAEDEIIVAELSEWSMPVQSAGYIKCKQHDFF